MNDLKTRIADALEQASEDWMNNLALSPYYGAHLADVLLSLPGIAIVDMFVVDGLIKSFRDVENGGERLYDAATHRWVDLLADFAANAASDGSGVSE